VPKAKKRRPLPLGSKFTREYGAKSYTLKVVKAKQGGVAYAIGKAIFGSPSTAARSITGYHANGWIWWGIEKK
jgi:hypothetical protein